MKGVNPDEVVAIGAAIQGGVLQGDVKDVLLLDVTPLEPWYRDHGRRHDQAHRAQHHHSDQQVRSFLDGRRQPAASGSPRGQGEREMIEGNKSLGRFVLDGIPPAPRGVPQIEVTFNIDANGILNVTAKDKGSGKEQSITISGSGNLDKDRSRENGQRSRSPRRRRQESQKNMEASEDKDELEKAVKDLNEKIMPIGSKLYEAAAKEAPKEGEPAADDKKTDEPVEGEVVDDKK